MAQFIRFAALSFVLTLLLFVAPAAARPAAAPLAGVRALSLGENGLSFSLHVPAYTVDRSGLLSAAGLDSLTADPGAPTLPYFSTLIALPPDATVTVTAQARAGDSRTLARPLPAAPRAASSPLQASGTTDDLAALARSLEAVAAPDPAVYGRDTLFPQQLYRLSEPMYYRDLRVVRLDLYPLRYNPVRGLLQYSAQIDVTLRFNGARFDDLLPAPTPGDNYVATLAGDLLNAEQTAVWRSLPAAPAVPEPGLPIGQDSYRIAVQEDGIYEITYTDLQDAGMDVAGADPTTFEMMYRGEPVAYELVGDNGDDQFDEGEAIRFYGWAFDGPRSEEQYVTENVFWLWPNGSPSTIAPLPESSAAQVAANFRAEVTYAPKYQYSNTRFDEDDWAAFPNEPDSWYWEWLYRSNVITTTVHTVTRTINLPHPAASGDAALTVELLSYDAIYPYGDVMVSMGPGFTHVVTTTWAGPQNDNIVLTLPASALQDGENPVRLTFYNHRANRIFYFLNRFTVSYPRLFIADGDQLIFDGDAANPRRYTIGNFTQGDASAPLVWEIGNRLQPNAVPDVSVAPEGGTYAYSFSSGENGARFIATNHAAVKTPASIERYDAPSLDPADGAAWLAITHPDFAVPVQELAAHRAKPDFGSLDTAVVSVEDVINQYGHGLPLPDAIRDYLAHALYTWPVAPQYVLLVGDVTTNPHHATCDGPNAAYTLCSYWEDDTQITYVPTHLLFKDRFQGHIPTDYPNVLLAGDDLLPDMAIGRLAVQTAAEAANIVAKIQAFETAQLDPGPLQRSLVFLSDNPDNGGDFPAASAAIAELIPEGYPVTLIAVADASEAAAEAARNATRDAIHAPNGAAVLNYRGHGSVFAWATNLFNANDPALWPWPDISPWNALDSEPLVILSLDCLDGNFIYPGQPSLGETFHALPDTGSVAHWSSTGLGFTFEHSALHAKFYEAIFDAGLLPIGDAINYAKAHYPLVYHDSELYSFTLQGDPAMRIWRLDLYPLPTWTFLPLITNP